MSVAYGDEFLRNLLVWLVILVELAWLFSLLSLLLDNAVGEFARIGRRESVLKWTGLDVNDYSFTSR